ncbi:MAG TPA: hypothetical protein VNR63_11275, partial [Gaiellaceae bacterium]|nr:hypothetical protein [Gaiellaceae bacterium]
MIQRALQRLLDGHDLTRDETREVMGEIMAGAATPARRSTSCAASRRARRRSASASATRRSSRPSAAASGARASSS